MKELRSIFIKLPSLLLVFLLASCTNEAPPKVLTPEMESSLVQRVTERWHAMEVKDFSRVYNYTTPNYRRVFSKQMFLNKFGYDVDWELTGVEVVNYDAQAAVASVAVRVMSMPTKPTSAASKALGALPHTVKEKWILIDGEWWNSAKI